MVLVGVSVVELGVMARTLARRGFLPFAAEDLRNGIPPDDDRQVSMNFS